MGVTRKDRIRNEFVRATASYREAEERVVWKCAEERLLRMLGKGCREWDEDKRA